MREFGRTDVTRRLVFLVIVFVKVLSATEDSLPNQLEQLDEVNSESFQIQNDGGNVYFTTVKPEIIENIDEEMNAKEYTLPVMQSKENYTIPQGVVDDKNVVMYQNDVKKGYLVYSEACQIPDVDPYHPTVLKLIKIWKPLDCNKDYPGLTYAQGNKLRINESLIDYWKDFNNVTVPGRELKCCYNEIVRARDGKSDSYVSYSKNCTPVKDGDEVKVEFILVRCTLKGHPGIFYKNYHSFVMDKPATEERCLNFEKNATTTNQQQHDKYNILVVGADAMSRLNMHRQMKKTFKYLIESMGGIEMNGFNKVGDNTFPNLIPLVMGVHQEELPEICRNESDPMDNCKLIWEEFANSGYRTFYAEDSPDMSSFNYVKPGFLTQPTDYYYRTMMRPYEKALGREHQGNSYSCVGSMAEAEAILDYGARFVSNFGQRKYFAMAWTNSISHDFLNSASSGDHFFANFFESLHKKSHLDNTLIIFMGDHGLRWGENRARHIGRMEERLPILIMVPPKNLQSKYPELYKNLRVNANRLVTPFDLYATIQNVLRFDGTAKKVQPDSVADEPQLKTIREKLVKRALSLFGPIPANRSCEDAEIAQDWCACHQSEPIDVKDKEVQHVAKFMTQKVNEMLAGHPECSKLKMKSVLKAKIRAPKNKLFAEARPKTNIFDYTVEIMTSPGDAKFEGTIRYVPLEHEHNLLGDVSRLNDYGNQTSCVKDAVLMKYCYCVQSPTS